MKSVILFIFSVTILGFSCFNTNRNPAKIAEEPFVLQHKIRQPKISIKKPPLLLLMHGFGSNEADMFSFADALDERLLVVSARAPYTISEGKYKWYDLNILETGRTINEAQAEESRKLILKFIDQLVAKYKVDQRQVFVGGFSQGAILSFSAGLTAPEKIKGIAAFSGHILEGIAPKYGSKDKLKNLHAFVSHGRQDQVLPYSDALKSQATLTELGVQLDFKSYDTTHTISQQNFIDFLSWLNGLL